MKIRHTDRMLGAMLTASNWNTLLGFLNDAKRHHEEHGYSMMVGEVGFIQHLIRDQVGSLVDEAFEKQFPDESNVLSFAEAVKLRRRS